MGPMIPKEMKYNLQLECVLKKSLYSTYVPNFIPIGACLVCVEVLRPSQPNGVMSSAVSLPNHTFTGQA